MIVVEVVKGGNGSGSGCGQQNTSRNAGKCTEDLIQQR
jgi:hypothetical protein